MTEHPTKESGIDGIETDPNEIAPMALFGLLIKEQEVETLAKGYMALREALQRIAGTEWPEARAIARAALEYRP